MRSDLREDSNPGGNEPLGYRVGPAIGVVAYNASVGAWVPDRRAAATLPAIAHRA